MEVDSDYICPICRDVSDQPQQLHYGGKACFSCRAFFRRAHQKTKNPGFVCKKNNACEVTVKTRRRCQKCRYDLALKAGMKPEAVLTEDQKKVRFRNAIEKKASKTTNEQDEDDVNDEDQLVADDRLRYDSGVGSSNASSSPEGANNAELPPLVIDERLISSRKFLSTHQPQQQLNLYKPIIGPPPTRLAAASYQTSTRPLGHFISGQIPFRLQQASRVEPFNDLAPKPTLNLKRPSADEPHNLTINSSSLENSVTKATPPSPKKVHFERKYNSLPLPVKKRKLYESFDEESETDEGAIKEEPTENQAEELEKEDTKEHILQVEEVGSTDEKNEEVEEEAVTEIEKMQGPFDFLMKGCGGPGCPLGRRQVQKVLAAFKLTCVQVQIDPHFVDTMVSFHRGDISKVPKQLFIEHLKNMNQQYQHFAMLHREFLSLHKRDKQSLVQRNAPLFIQYILGRYFTSETGYEQLKWILGIHAPTVPTEEQGQFKLISLVKFNKRIGLFKKYACLPTYDEFCKRLNYKEMKYRCTSVWNHIILYHYDKDIRLIDRTAVHSLCEDSMSMLPHSAHYFGCTVRPNIHGMIATTEAMVKFFKANVQWMSPILDEATSSSDEDKIKYSAKAISLR